MAMRALDLNRTYTVAEFEALPEFDGRYEFDNGRVIKKPMTGDEHNRIASNLTRKYLRFDLNDALGRYWAEGSFVIERGWIPEPDWAFIVTSKLPPMTKGAIRVVPDFVVEVLSPNQLNTASNLQIEVSKILRYLNGGVQLAWLINPANQTVDVYRQGAVLPTTKGYDDELSGEDIIPGFVIKVSDLFKE